MLAWCVWPDNLAIRWIMIVLRPRLSDILSFEFLFILFLVSGAIKEAAFIAPLNARIDVTVLTVACGLLAGTVVVLRRPRLLNQDQTQFALAFCLLVGLTGLSYAISGLPTDEMTLKLQKFAVFNGWAVMVPLLVVNTPTRVERLLRLFVAYTAIVILQALVASQQQSSVVFVGVFGTNHYHALGRAAGIGGILAFGLLLLDSKKSHHVIYAGALACAIMVVFVSSMRQALVGMAPAGFCLLWWMKRWRFSPLQVVRSSIAVVLAVVAFMFVKSDLLSEVNLDHVWRRMLAVFGVGGATRATFVDSGRPQLWAEGIQLWMSHPFLGTGFGSHAHFSPSGMRHPHNFFVELSAELGIVGLILGIALITPPIRRMFFKRRDRQAWSLAITQAICVFLFTCAMVSGDLTDNRLLFAFMALSLTASEASKPTTAKRAMPFSTPKHSTHASVHPRENPASPPVNRSTLLGEQSC